MIELAYPEPRVFFDDRAGVHIEYKKTTIDVLYRGLQAAIKVLDEVETKSFTKDCPCKYTDTKCHFLSGCSGTGLIWDKQAYNYARIEALLQSLQDEGIL